MPDELTHACNPSTGKVEAGGLGFMVILGCRVMPGQPGLHELLVPKAKPTKIKILAKHSGKWERWQLSFSCFLLFVHSSFLLVLILHTEPVRSLRDFPSSVQLCEFGLPTCMISWVMPFARLAQAPQGKKYRSLVMNSFVLGTRGLWLSSIIAQTTHLGTRKHCHKLG